MIKEKGISNITNDDEVLEIVNRVINENSESVNDYKNGHDRAIKFLMGQVMKESCGKVNPAVAMRLLQDELSKLK